MMKKLKEKSTNEKGTLKNYWTLIALFTYVELHTGVTGDKMYAISKDFM